MSGNAGKYLRAGASGLEWAGAGGGSGIRSMQVWTSNGTWTRPSNCKSIIVTVTGAGGGGSGYCESGGAGGTSERVIDVSNVSSVSVTVGNPGGALTTLDVVGQVILLLLVVTAQHLVVLVQTALLNMLVGMVVMDQVVT